MILVVSCLELDEHEIAGADGRRQEEDLHSSVVHRDEAESQIVSLLLKCTAALVQQASFVSYAHSSILVYHFLRHA